MNPAPFCGVLAQPACKGWVKKGLDEVMKNSKIPLYVMVSLLSILIAFAWNAMLNKRKPDMVVKGDLRITYNHYKEEDVGYPYRFFVNVSKRGSPLTSDAVKVYWLKGEDFKAKYPDIKKADFSIATMSGTQRGDFYAHLFESRSKNQRYYFFMEIDSPEGSNNIIPSPRPAGRRPAGRTSPRRVGGSPPNGVASRLSGEGVITMPENALGKKVFYRVTYKQDPNKWGLLIHILLMLVAFILLIHAFYFAFDYLWNKTEWNISKAVSSIFWGLTCYGISSFPLGFWIAYEKSGVVWGGLPVGFDVTDNKTLFNFMYYLILLILMKGSVLYKDHQHNIISKNAFAWLTILGGILSIVIRFAIPHGDI
ncbi:MAG: hypothetical protein QME51_02625 [Planctomycetota bacterium]|nr:hypothetical protein [Planctomycetota bacterium]MDI6787249.1 hypothetical protein [Planctomycetota bacterium]